ncbi:MAG TPA: APC family permease, partial [Virgibacillus sp.]
MQTEKVLSGGINPKSSKTGGELGKVLKTKDLVIFGLVFMAPVSAQTLFGELSVLSQGHAVLSYLFALVAMLFTASSYGVMAGTFPKAGSTYSYTSQAIHPYVGFVAGWAILLDYLVMPILLTKLSATFLMELLPFIPLWFMLLLFLIPITVFNYYGTKLTARVNLFMTVAMLLSLVLFIGFAIKNLVSDGGAGAIFSFQGVINSNTFSSGVVLSGASIAVLSYLGFDAVTTMAEDSKVTGKMVGTAAVISLLFASFFYILQVYFATLVMPDFTSFGSQDTAFFEIATLVGGSALATICTLIIAVSGISTGLAGQSAGSRILFGMGRDKVLPKFFAHVHEKYKTPSNSIIILAILGYVGALFLPLDFIFSIMVFGALTGFMCVNLSVVVEFFFKRKIRQGSKLFLHFIFPAFGILICGFIMINMDVIGLIAGVTWIAIGTTLLIARIKYFKVNE